MKMLSFSKLFVLLLAMTALTFTSCDDDNDDIIGVNIGDGGFLFLSSNTSGRVGVTDVDDRPLEIETFTAAGIDSDGIVYDDNSDVLFQVNRTNNRLVSYEDVTDDVNDPSGVSILNQSTSDFSNGRGLASIGNSQFIVAQDGNDDNDNTNALVIFTYTDDNGFVKSKTIPTPFNLWGIQVVNNRVFAIADNSDSLAVYNNLFDMTDGMMASPDRYIKIDGIERTHGLEYDETDDLMILTDIGDADSGEDGGLIMITNFSTRNGNTITSSDYTRISGSNTMLGNPVDVDYDEKNERVYVAERKRNGGMLLVFDANASGNVAPVQTAEFAGLSSLYLNR